MSGTHTRLSIVTRRRRHVHQAQTLNPESCAVSAQGAVHAESRHARRLASALSPAPSQRVARGLRVVHRARRAPQAAARGPERGVRRRRGRAPQEQTNASGSFRARALAGGSTGRSAPALWPTNPEWANPLLVREVGLRAAASTTALHRVTWLGLGGIVTVHTSGFGCRSDGIEHWPRDQSDTARRSMGPKTQNRR